MRAPPIDTWQGESMSESENESESMSKMMNKKRESMSAPPIASWQEPRHCDDTLMTPMLSLSTKNGTKYG